MNELAKETKLNTGEIGNSDTSSRQFVSENPRRHIMASPILNKLVKTKIVCTLGPASSSKEVLREMIKAGMDLVRLNFSHGKHEEHTALFNQIRSLGDEFDNQISIICDIQGPKIRTGIMEAPFQVNNGDKISVTAEKVVGTPKLIQISYANIVKDLDKGDTIFINDGIIKLVVEDKTETALNCVVQAGGMISNHKGCNIPKGNLSVEVVTPKDKRDLELIAKLNPEYVAASFIETAEDIKTVRSILKEYGNESIKIIAKIERPRALQKLDEIIEETDAIMVARGDLGVEIDTWEVPVRQKEMCRKCNAAGKPIIVATQMLESMTSSPRPTRAEANDVFNAVLDGADAVMLSGETSVGQYPVQAVTIMDNIVAVAEKSMPPRNLDSMNSQHVGMTETIATGAFVMSHMMNSKIKWPGKLIVVTGPPSGYVARMVSKYRPAYDIIAISDDLRTARELNLVWGVRSVFDSKLLSTPNMEERNAEAVRKALELKLIDKEDHVLVVARSLLGKHVGSTSCIYYVKEVLERSDTPFTSHN